MDKVLSIFIDESGDFGEYDSNSPYYLITLLMHNQNSNINTDLDSLNKNLTNIGFPNHMIHAGPLIRREEFYKNIKIEERKNILRYGMQFIRKIDITYNTFAINKQVYNKPIHLSSQITKHLNLFIDENREYLN